MVSNISLGSFFTTSTGQNVLGGAGGSGLDTQTIVNSLVQVQQDANITPLNNDVTANTNKLSALSQLQTLVTTLQSAASQLHNVPGFDTASQNAFSYVTANVSSNAGVTGSDYLSVTAEPGSAAQSYTVNQITQLAAATKQTTGTFAVASSSTSVVAATSTPGMFTAGTITITTNTGTANITMNAGDSLDQVASEFNAVSAQTGISANVLQVGSGSYQMVFTATQTGTANAFDISTANSMHQITSGASVLANVGIATTQTAANAEFSLDGVALTRSTNTVSDAISGLTFNLLQVTPNASPMTPTAGSELTVNITPDTTTAENAIVNFMNAYNAIKQFAANQNQVNADGTLASTDYLANDNAMNGIIQNVESYISGIVPGISSDDYNSLADLGISFTSTPATTSSTGTVTQAATTNVLTYDQSTLESALSSNFSQVAALFQFSFTSNNSNLSMYSGPTSLPANVMTLTINPGTSTFTAAYTDSSGNPQTVNLTATLNSTGDGYTLTAPANSALNGMVLLYGSTANATITANATQGVGDLVYQYATNALTANTGAIAVEQSSIQASNTSLQNQITTQTNLLDQYQTQLLNKFSELEQAVSQANSILESLTAQQDAALSSSSGG